MTMSNKQAGLVGYWPLQGDSQDYSGHDNHAVNYGVDLERGVFDGKSSYLAVAPSPSLSFAGEEFTLAAWVSTGAEIEGVFGDIMSKFDANARKGFSLSLKSSAGGYNSQGSDRHLHFGIDDGKVSAWEPCGRPSPYSNYVSNSLTVFDGNLYAGTLDAEQAENWCHVYRYQGEQAWFDCGRVGNLRTKGVGPMIVHNRKLYAGTWNYDWTRVFDEPLDYCHVYEYAGDQEWIDRGQPGFNLRLIGMASYKGQLYVAGDDRTGGSFKIFVLEDGDHWRQCATIPGDFLPHALGVYHGTLYIGTGSIHAYDGVQCAYVGTPLNCTQVHSLETYQGELYAGTWPEGKLFQYKGGETWEDCGRLGDSIELNALAVYNGKLYAGSIPRAEVYRYEGGQQWTRLARFYSPADWIPELPVVASKQGVNEWTRVTSLTVFKGRLFASIASCTGSILDAPCDVRGQVFSMQAGHCITDDRDLGVGRKHIAAVRAGSTLALYINGELAVTSTAATHDAYDITNREPLKIGFGTEDFFSGAIQEVRVYDRALATEQVRQLYDESKAKGLDH